jgi:nucleotide-binding universal stress UspA family protein
MFERILIPLDGSPRAELILSQIARILKREDSEILLLRVIGSGVEFGWAGEASSLSAELQKAAEKYIDDRVTRLADPGAKVRGRVAAGAPSETILKIAGEEGSTMIAMTTHGRTGLPRWFMGSVAEKVVRASDVPVLLVRSFRSASQGAAEPATSGEVPFRKLLVPTDGSPASMAVVTPVKKLAQLFNSEIVVLHVQRPYIPPGAILPGMDAGVMPPPTEPTPSEEDETTREAAERFRQAGLRVTRQTVLGDPSVEIIDQGSASGIDLIALSTHGRSGLSRWLTGSVTERVLRHAGVPLLIVRAAEPKADRSLPRVA